MHTRRFCFALSATRCSRLLASAALVLILAAPGTASGQASRDAPATFNERYPVEPPASPPAAAPAPASEPAPAVAPAPAAAPTGPAVNNTKPANEQTGSAKAQSVPRREPVVTREPSVYPAGRGTTRAQSVSTEERSIETTGRMTRRERGRSRVVVVPRSFLDAGTEVLPGERKFLDYAFPPNHTPMDVVTNTGGRVGWHTSPLPGPLFPSQN
jgi:hypothetical protein